MEESRPKSPILPGPIGRRRLQACQRCWKRKQKCDRLLPLCTTCVEANSECRPRSVAIRSSQEEATGLSNVAVPDYIESLKRKAEDLDDQHRRQRARLANDDVPGSSQSPPMATNPQITAGSSHVTPLTDNTTLTERSVQAAMGEIGYLSRNAMAEPRDETRGFPQELAMSNMIKASLAISGEDPTRSLHVSSQRHKLVNMVNQAPKLSEEFSLQYLDGFLERVIMYCPYIEDANFREHFGSFFDTIESTPNSFTTTLRDFNVHMAVAIGMLVSSDRGIDLLTMSLHTSAMEKFAKILESNDGVDIIDCMLLLIVYSLYSSSGGSAWHLVGLAMKKAIAYRFHKEPHSLGELSADKLNRRRRLFWNLYTLDRMISSVMDRPFSIEDDDISLKYPGHESTMQSRETLDFGYHIFMHARLMSKMRSFPSQHPVSQYGSLCYWRDIPTPLKVSIARNSLQSRRANQLACRALIHLVHLGCGGKRSTNVIGTTKTIEEDAVNSCRQYINGEYESSEQGSFSGTFIDGFDILAAGVVFMCIGRTSSFSRTSTEVDMISKCTTLLTILGERFPSLRSLHRVLWDLQRSQDGMV